jgi:hypothetical protein
MNANRQVIRQFLQHANEAIGRGETEGAEFMCWWDNFSAMNGGIEGPRTWAQMKRIAEAILADGKEPEVYDVPGDYGQCFQIIPGSETDEVPF